MNRIVYTIKHFLKWMRNGIAFVYTWLVLLLLVRNQIFGIESVSTSGLVKLFVMVTGAVMLFCICFLKGIIKNMSFLMRLTVCMISIVLFEIFGFYWIGIFTEKGTIKQWFVFGGIVLVLYFCCIGISYVINKKKGALYTKNLIEYQKERSIVHGKNQREFESSIF